MPNRLSDDSDNDDDNDVGDGGANNASEKHVIFAVSGIPQAPTQNIPLSQKHHICGRLSSERDVPANHSSTNHWDSAKTQRRPPNEIFTKLLPPSVTLSSIHPAKIPGEEHENSDDDAESTAAANDDQRDSAEEPTESSRKGAENFPEPLFRFLLDNINPTVLAQTEAILAEDWVSHMAIVAVWNSFRVDFASYGSLQPFKRIWDVDSEHARVALKVLAVQRESRKQNAEDQKQANMDRWHREEIIKEFGSLDAGLAHSVPVAPRDAVSHTPETEAIPECLNVDFLTICLPFRLAMPLSKITKILVRFNFPEAAETIRQLSGYSTEKTKLLDLKAVEAKERSAALRSRACAESTPTEHPTITPTSFTPGVLKEFISKITPKKRGAERAVKLAAKIAAWMRVSEEPALDDECLAVWRDRFGLASMRVSEIGIDGAAIISENVELFLEVMSKMVDGAYFEELLSRHHLLFGSEKILDDNPITTGDLAALFMRIEGCGRVFGRGNDSYWFDGTRYQKFRSKRQYIGPISRQIEVRIREVLDNAIKGRWAKINAEISAETIAERAKKLSAPNASGNANETTGKMPILERHKTNLESAARQLGNQDFIHAVLVACLAQQTEVTTEPVEGPQRRFPKLPEEVERALLVICEAFGPQHREPTDTVFQAYLGYCGTKNPKFTACSSFCRELYKQDDSFHAVKCGHRWYVVGLCLKNGD